MQAFRLQDLQKFAASRSIYNPGIWKNALHTYLCYPYFPRRLFRSQAIRQVDSRRFNCQETDNYKSHKKNG